LSTHSVPGSQVGGQFAPALTPGIRGENGVGNPASPGATPDDEPPFELAPLVLPPSPDEPPELETIPDEDDPVPLLPFPPVEEADDAGDPMLPLLEPSSPDDTIVRSSPLASASGRGWGVRPPQLAAAAAKSTPSPQSLGFSGFERVLMPDACTHSGGAGKGSLGGIAEPLQGSISREEGDSGGFVLDPLPGEHDKSARVDRRRTGCRGSGLIDELRRLPVGAWSRRGRRVLGRWLHEQFGHGFRIGFYVWLGLVFRVLVIGVGFRFRSEYKLLKLQLYLQLQRLQFQRWRGRLERLVL
jgi:hypothetical protein